jgi:catechol 2,3-dioxygenase-like lactoylglutathione lyase family enzyme
LVRNPDHITLAVTDADAAGRFLELLGFRKTHVEVIDGGVPAAYMGMPNMKAQHITFELEGADPVFEIQLLVFDSPPPPAGDDTPTHCNRRGFNHLAFRVDDIAATTAHLEANGVKMLNEEMDYISRRLRFFEGPEGITLELVEVGGHQVSGRLDTSLQTARDLPTSVKTPVPPGRRLRYCDKATAAAPDVGSSSRVTRMQPSWVASVQRTYSRGCLEGRRARSVSSVSTPVQHAAQRSHAGGD